MSLPAAARRSSDQVVLPSGKTISVAYVADPSEDLGQCAGLHVCRSCRSTLVQPLDWQPLTGRRWAVTLRCPECSWAGTGDFSDAEVVRLEAETESGTEAMLRTLKSLARANDEQAIETFALALASDLICPEDF